MAQLFKIKQANKSPPKPEQQPPRMWLSGPKQMFLAFHEGLPLYCFPYFLNLSRRIQILHCGLMFLASSYRGTNLKTKFQKSRNYFSRSTPFLQPLLDSSRVLCLTCPMWPQPVQLKVSFKYLEPQSPLLLLKKKKKGLYFPVPSCSTSCIIKVSQRVCKGSTNNPGKYMEYMGSKSCLSHRG